MRNAIKKFNLHKLKKNIIKIHPNTESENFQYLVLNYD